MAVTAAVAVAATVFAPSHQVEAAINGNSKAAVKAAYLNELAPALATPSGWTGSTASCDPGTETAASRKATIEAVNFMRELTGLKTVKLHEGRSEKALDAALVFAANDSLSHDIPRSWKCYSADAAEAAAKSNIAWSSDSTYGGANSILGYMHDSGSSNTAVGHRRWILNPGTTSMGTGSTDSTNALWVIGSSSKRKSPTWVEWPASGYFPSQLEPDGRWSLSANAAGRFSFSSAKITVKNAAGKKLRVKKYKQSDYMGNDTLVFEVAGVKAPQGTSKVQTYTVKVTGIKKAGSKKKLSHSYKVRLFDPEA